MSSERLARIDAFIQDAIDQKRVAGVVTLIARKGKIVQFKAYGMADIGSGVKMRTDHMFRLFSQMKPITSTAILMLYEQGKFQLTDPLEKYIPEFKDVKVYTGLDEKGSMELEEPKRKITIQDVFRHTAGFSALVSSPTTKLEHPVVKAYSEAGLRYKQIGSLKDLVIKLARMPLLYHPGEQWVYSAAHDVQAYLVEVFSGMPFDEYIYKNITGPLGMKDTVFGMPIDYVNRFASVYNPAKETGALEVDKSADLLYSSMTNKPLGGVGLSCTAMDYFLFSQMLLNNGKLGNVRILGRKTVELMTSNHLPSNIPHILDNEGLGYGLGVGVNLDPVKSGQLESKGAFGWGGAAMTRSIIDPEEELIWSFYAQHLPSDEFGMRFPILVYQAIID